MPLADYQEFWPVLARLGAATAMGAAIGINRDLHHKPAGVRVMSLVALGAATVTMSSVLAIRTVTGETGDGVLRTVQGILSGVGFLGAGVILRGQRSEAVQGMTTAAAIWIACILGIVAGLAQLPLGAVAFGLTMLVLVAGRRIEMLIQKLGTQDDAPYDDDPKSNPPPES